MRSILELSFIEAKEFFLKESSYFNGDLPQYISFEPILSSIDNYIKGKSYRDYKSDMPAKYEEVNYHIISNKDGNFDWRPYEIMNPLIYVSLVNIICKENNWKFVTEKITEFNSGCVECCSIPRVSTDESSDKATQVHHWWQLVEQKSLCFSLQYSHILHTDVTNCYGSLYTHSVAWALHGIEETKKNRKLSLLGNNIDTHIRDSRYGQTNGISQGSVLMDFVAELVLGFVDTMITEELVELENFSILRYRDDYRIFTNSDEQAEIILRVISDKLRIVGMKLNATKTITSKNIINSSVKPDKLSGIDLQDLGQSNAKTIQKQLLRLHTFGKRYPNSGALKRLLSELHKSISQQQKIPKDIEVQVAIATDIAFVSPATFPAVAGILSFLISLSPDGVKTELWEKVRTKMKRVPYNGYLEIWLQRVVKPKKLGIKFKSEEPICKIVDGERIDLWYSNWISDKNIVKILKSTNVIIKEPEEISETIEPKEIELFTQNAWIY